MKEQNDDTEIVRIKMFEIWLIKLFNKDNPEEDARFGTKFAERDAEAVFLDSAWNIRDAIKMLTEFKKTIYTDRTIQDIKIFETDSMKKEFWGVPFL